MTYYDTALEFATKAHAGQFRWDRKTPYIEHPKAVAEICKDIYPKYLFPEYALPSLLFTAIAHDLEEDCKDITRNVLSDELDKEVYKNSNVNKSLVLNALDRLNKNNYPDYLEFTLAARENAIARIVKIADITHNLSDLKKKGSMKDKYLLALYILNT